MKSYGRILWFVAVLSVAVVGAAFAIRPSGPGINTKANSLSVAIATDQPAVSVNDTPTNAVAGTRAELDAGSAGVQNCLGGIYVLAAGDGGLVLVPYGATDAAATVTLSGVTAGRLPIATQRVVTTGTTVGSTVCLNP